MQKNYEHFKINSLSLRCTIQYDRRVGIELYMDLKQKSRFPFFIPITKYGKNHPIGISMLNLYTIKFEEMIHVRIDG